MIAGIARNRKGFPKALSSRLRGTLRRRWKPKYFVICLIFPEPPLAFRSISPHSRSSFPHMVKTSCGDYTHLTNIANKKIKKRKGGCRACAKQQGNNHILCDLRRTNLSICSVLNIYNFCLNGCGRLCTRTQPLPQITLIYTDQKSSVRPILQIRVIRVHP